MFTWFFHMIRPIFCYLAVICSSHTCLLALDQWKGRIKCSDWWQWLFVTCDGQKCFILNKPIKTSISEINYRFTNGSPWLSVLTVYPACKSSFLSRLLKLQVQLIGQGCANLVPRSLVDKANGETWQSKKICFSWLAAHLTPVKSPLWR